MRKECSLSVCAQHDGKGPLCQWIQGKFLTPFGYITLPIESSKIAKNTNARYQPGDTNF